MSKNMCRQGKHSALVRKAVKRQRPPSMGIPRGYGMNNQPEQRMLGARQVSPTLCFVTPTKELANLHHPHDLPSV